VNAAAGKLRRSGTFRSLRLSGCANLTELMRLNPTRYPFLLQSITQGQGEAESATNQLARYDVLFAFPGETLRLTSEGVDGSELSTTSATGEPASASDEGFLTALDHWWQAEANATEIFTNSEADSGLPFTGGWFLYLGYELAAEVEPGLLLPMPEDAPVAFATRVQVAIINDRLTGETILLAEPEAEDKLIELQTDLAKLSPEPPENRATVQGKGVLQLNEAPAADFLSAVQKAQDYIREGDIFQANLSRLWHAELSDPVTAVELYERLCETNPAPFAGLLLQDDFAVISSSPERLVRRCGSRIDTRPIAGTLPRTDDQDRLLAAQEALLNNPKERAEHIMLIDLERNDLGRVCKGGSVEVDEYMVVENYSHVHHIVSNVKGTARDDLTPGELIRAVFPGGTITGCPKVRCMEIIQELEGRVRGAYTGSMGYLNLNGDCDLNILIRTMTLRGRELELAAGSGVVADSDPERELQETRAKAKGMLLALGERHK
jgi:anthranilate synthase component 1